MRMLKVLVRLLVNRNDLVCVAQRESESKFFRVEANVIKKILNGNKLNVLDIGASGGIEDGFKKYNHLLNIILVEPDPEALLQNRKGDTVIKNLIGGKDEKVFLNICKSRMVSSILDLNGEFLDYLAAGDTERFDVIDRILLPMSTIESAMKKTGNRVDYLKMDTEGTEHEIIKGFGDFRPLIIKTEIGFVSIRKDQAIFFHLGKELYDMGYILFHLAYGGKSAPAKYKSNKPWNETIMPLQGDAWFMPDWTRSEGIKMIKGRKNSYKALMEIFGMREILKYSLDKIRN